MNQGGYKKVSNFKETLNLPHTDFPMKANLPQREPERIKKWEELKIYHKMINRRGGGPLFILHDGPPYSNGHIHLGQALNKILKDFLVKYKALRGYFTPFIPGWDNHGMPIENEVVRSDPDLSFVFKDTETIKKPEIKIKIREKCRAFASKWVDIQKKEFIRLGVFADWENPYLTMAKDYEAEELKIFADFVKMGYIYRGTMPIHWCHVCQTALAMAEIEYKEKTSPSLWFRFRIKEDKKGIFNGKEGFALVWTTTPWTIISNVAIAFYPNFTYVVVEADGTRYLLAEELLDKNREKLGFKDAKIVKKLKGSEIENTIFEHPFYDRESIAILADFVTLETGTGIVHIAPGHGREDFDVAQKYGLPVLSTVNELGKFTREAGPIFEGLDVETTSEKVIEVLKERGHFLHCEDVVHSYPHCWRCKTPLIFRATSQWFLRVDHNDLRKKALHEIKKVRWHPPDSINRITASVAERPDWVLSRQRAWGVNIPAFYCLNCGYLLLDPEVIRHVASIFEKEGSDAWHRLSVSELLPKDTVCPKCGSKDFEKELDILDVWFDSGATSLIVLKKSPLNWPSDVYLEGPDQHRGWFNAALMLGVAEKNRAPYKVVITHGWTLDEEGKAMHKSLGNVISPLEVTEKYGADVLRLWVGQSDYTEDVRLGKEILERTVESYRKIRNTFRFMLGNLYDFDPIKDYVKYEELFPVDRYILHRLEEVKENASKSFEDLEFHKMFHRTYQFAVVDLSSFYLDVTKDRLYTWGKNSKGRRGAQTCIYECLRTLLILFSPILSFTTDEAWEFLPGEKEESVFMAEWPAPNPDYKDPKLATEFENLLSLREKVLLAIEKARKEKNILSDRLEAKVLIYPKEAFIKELLEKNYTHLPELFIVSQVELLNSKEDAPVEVEDEVVFVGVKHADGKKCARCWIWDKETGKDKEYPDICPKCIRVLRDDSDDH